MGIEAKLDTKPIEVSDRPANETELIRTVGRVLSFVSQELGTMDENSRTRIEERIEDEGVQLYCFHGSWAGESFVQIRSLSASALPIERWREETVIVERTDYKMFSDRPKRRMAIGISPPERNLPNEPRTYSCDKNGNHEPTANHEARLKKINTGLKTGIWVEQDLAIFQSYANQAPIEYVRRSIEEALEMIALVDRYKLRSCSPEEGKTLLEPLLKAMQKLTSQPNRSAGDAPIAAFIIAKKISDLYIGDKSGRKLYDDPWFNLLRETFSEETLMKLFPGRFYRLSEEEVEGVEKVEGGKEVKWTLRITCDHCGGTMGADTVKPVVVESFLFLDQKGNCPKCGGAEFSAQRIPFENAD